MMQAKRTMHAVIERRNLTPMQGTLLVLFEPGKGKSMHSLSCVMGCDPSNITGLVDRLELQKLIERTVDPTDRRVKMIKLSKDGEACRDEILASIDEAEAIDMKKLSNDEIQQFGRLLDKLTADVLR